MILRSQEIDVRGTPIELDGYIKLRMANILSTELATSCARDFRLASAHKRLVEFGVHISGTRFINATDAWAIILPNQCTHQDVQVPKFVRNQGKGGKGKGKRKGGKRPQY